MREERATAEAAAWLARLQRGDVEESDGLEFDAWLAEPANRAAYANALAVWHEFEAMPEGVLDELGAETRRAELRRAPSRRWLVGAAGAAIAAGLAAVAVLPTFMAEPSTATYATGKGEHQRVALADGSVVDLNAETSIKVTYGRAERRVVLDEGEAIFDVAHEQDRPFTVATASRVVRVLGTQFDVRQRRGEVAVTVARGRVQVAPRSAATTGRTLLLTPGQRLEVAADGVERVREVDPQEAFGWRAGRLVYRGEPLENVIADLNRQFAQQIEISDSDLGRMPITGVIVLDDQEAVVARLSLMLPVRSVRSERGLLLLRK